MKTFSKNIKLSIISLTVALTFIVIPLGRNISVINAEETSAISEISLSVYSVPYFIVKGTDNNFWFSDIASNSIGRMTTTGEVTNFVLPSGSATGITNGLGGDIWFTERSSNKIGKITNLGTITEFLVTTNNSGPFGIVLGADSNIWFTELDSNKIGKITPAGVVTEFSIPTINSWPAHITLGSDGNLWFTENAANKIGRITPTGIITEFQVPTNTSSFGGITSGPDGNIWFTEYSGNKIGRLTPQGTITEFVIPTSGSGPLGITTGPDGKLWFTEADAKKIGQIITSGIIMEFSSPNISGVPFSIVTGPDNNIWFTEKNIISKIGRVVLSNITPVPTNTVTPTPTQNPYADFKQTDPDWGDDHLNNSLSCGTMYGYGCAITSVADVFNAYGKVVLANTSTLLTPGSLNNWLANNSGFKGCSIYWGAASSAVQLGVPINIGRNGSVDWVAGRQAIDNALSAGNLPILGILTNNNSAGTHYIVVTEKLPDVNGKPDYRIIDPALYPFTANNPGKTGLPLSQAYGGFDKVFQYVIYKKDSSPQNSLAIGGHSPIQLLITDPLGNKTGYDMETGEIIEKIANASYVIEPGIAPVDGSLPAANGKKYFQQVNPSVGEYKVQVIGTGDDEYTIGFSKTDENGKLSLNEIHGIAQTGVTETYHVTNTLDASIPVILNKEVTFQSLISNINELSSLNLITQKSVSNSLIRNLEQAQKAAQAGDKSKVNQNLDQFISILDREKGRKITENAYQILLDNVTFLKGQF